MNSGKIHVSNK